MASCLQLPSTGHLAANLVSTHKDLAVRLCQDDIAVPAHLHASLSAAPVDQGVLHVALL